MSELRVRRSEDAGVVTIEVGDGSRRNALGVRDWRELRSVVGAAAHDPATSVIVLVGTGTTFSAGSDISEWADAGPDDVDGSFAEMERCFRAVERAPVPVVAAVEGVAVGAGCQLALACDVVVMGETARMGMPIVRLGILPSAAFAARVCSRVGPALAADLYLTGRLLSGLEAAAVGLVARVVSDGEALAQATELAWGIADSPRVAVRAAKRAVHAVSRTDPDDVMPLEDTGSVDFAAFRPAVLHFLSAGRRSA